MLETADSPIQITQVIDLRGEADQTDPVAQLTGQMGWNLSSVSESWHREQKKDHQTRKRKDLGATEAWQSNCLRSSWHVEASKFGETTKNQG
jgi:hypothetical protein